MPPEEVGVNVGVTICKKSPVKAAMAITAGKLQEVATLRHAVLAVADFASESLVFEVKKFPDSIKDLKTVKSGDQKLKKQTVATEKRVAATIAQNH